MTDDARPEPVLTGRSVRLLPFADTHLTDPSYREWLRDVDVVGTLNLPRYVSGAVTDAEIAEYCRRLMASPDVLYFAIEVDGDGFAGTAKAGPIDRYAGTADIGIMIGRKDLWGRGLASETIALIARHLFDTVGLRKLTAGSMANNPAMVRVFEKLGFRKEGVFRAQDRVGDDYVDHIHLGCFRDELSLG